jgi:hypothetical protein
MFPGILVGGMPSAASLLLRKRSREAALALQSLGELRCGRYQLEEIDASGQIQNGQI